MIRTFCRFSISWWAYTFPMTAASIASIQYSHVAPSVITRALALVLSFVSSATVFTLFCSTLLHAFVWHTLFPNDLAIAITAYKPKFYTPKPEDDGGCGLASLHHSEPLYKSMMDAYHHFLSSREQQELRHCKTEPPNPRASLSPESTNGSSHPDPKQARSTSLWWIYWQHKNSKNLIATKLECLFGNGFFLEKIFDKGATGEELQHCKSKRQQEQPCRGCQANPVDKIVMNLFATENLLATHLE